MRLYEIVARPNRVAVTTKFASSYPKFARDYPGLPEVILDFIKTKFNGGTFGKRDYKFTGPLSPFYHAHLDTIDGLSVVLYDQAGGVLRLYDLVTHDEYEGPRSGPLRKYLRKAKASGDFIDIDPKIVFTTSRPTSRVLNAGEKKKITDEIHYLIANEGFNTLAAAVVDDNWDELINWLKESLDDPKISKTDIFAAFGGQEGLNDAIIISLRNFGKMDDFKEFLSQ